MRKKGGSAKKGKAAARPPKVGRAVERVACAGCAGWAAMQRSGMSFADQRALHAACSPSRWRMRPRSRR